MTGEKRKHILLIAEISFLTAVVVWGLVLFLGSGQAATNGKVAPIDYNCKWVLQYDEHDNLISEELIYKGASKSQGIYYEYDEDGNRIQRKNVDYEYDEGHETMTYDYENGRLVGKSSSNNSDYYNFSYDREWDGYVYAKNTNDGSGDIRRYKLNDQNQVLAVEHYDQNSTNQIESYTRCSYSEDGKLKSLVLKVAEFEKFTYEYDYEDGVLSKIDYRYQDSFDDVKLHAEFDYEKNSEDYEVSLYDDENTLLVEFVYLHDEEGRLSEVYVNYDEAACEGKNGTEYFWGHNVNMSISYQDNYPGNEVPESFYE